MDERGGRDLPAQTGDGAESPTTVDILGCRVSKVTLVEAIDLIEGWIRRPGMKPRYVVATGFHGLWEAQKNPEFQTVLNSADLFCPDGIAPVWLSRLNGEALPERVPGPDLLGAFLSRADAAGYSSFFFGDTEETLVALQQKIESVYPGHRIAGVLSPPFREMTEEEDSMTLARINEANPDVLWVGLGMPKQDWWIYNHLDKLRAPVVVGVGAAFQFLSGVVKRAPAWMGETGFEWLWRLAAEPRKLWRRDLIEGPRFLAHAFLTTMRANKLPGPTIFQRRGSSAAGSTPSPPNFHSDARRMSASAPPRRK